MYFVFGARLVVVARVLRGRVIVELRERDSAKNADKCKMRYKMCPAHAHTLPTRTPSPRHTVTDSHTIHTQEQRDTHDATYDMILLYI